jgi:hypothetical protein
MALLYHRYPPLALYRVIGCLHDQLHIRTATAYGLLDTGTGGDLVISPDHRQQRLRPQLVGLLVVRQELVHSAGHEF